MAGLTFGYGAVCYNFRMRTSVIAGLLISLCLSLLACGSGPADTAANSGEDVPTFEEGVATDLVKKALRSISGQQSGCQLLLRIGGWTEQYDGDGIWSVTAKRGKPFRVHELTSRVIELGAGVGHSHDQYACHPSRSA